MNFIDKLIASDVAIKISFAAAYNLLLCNNKNLEMEEILLIYALALVLVLLMFVCVRAREIVL